MIITNNIHIKNFKSIKDICLDGLKTYNLFVGRPNVGKSNILEAIGSFSIPFLAGRSVSLYPLMRVNNIPQIFHNGNIYDEALVETDVISLNMKFISKTDMKLEFCHEGDCTNINITDMYVKKLIDADSLVKPYQYGLMLTTPLKHNTSYLTPLTGVNLMHVVQGIAELKKEFSELLKGYGLVLVFDTASQSIQIMKLLDENSSFLIPYSALADTLKRLLFYKAAVMSNTNSILTFEEIEAHAYPPYIVKIVQTILQKPDNQYFITTHSPYVINEFLQNKNTDVAIHIVDYKEGATFVKTLSEEEIDEVYSYGIDLFFNTESYI